MTLTEKLRALAMKARGRTMPGAEQVYDDLAAALSPENVLKLLAVVDAAERLIKHPAWLQLNLVDESAILHRTVEALDDQT